MADVQKNTNSVIAWLALIFGALALPISIVAYNRSGEDLDETIESRTANVVNEAQDVTEQAGEEFQEAKNEITESAQQVQLRTEFQTRLIKIQSEVKENNVTEETVTEVQNLRTDFRNAYANTTGDLKEQVEEIDQDLAKLETEVRQNTASALTTIENLLERMRDDVLSEEDDR